MQNNFGRYVKWQDEEEGWHTGRVIEYPRIAISDSCKTEGEVEFQVGFASYTKAYTLVQESCCGTLTWIEKKLLQPWAMQSECKESYDAVVTPNQPPHLRLTSEQFQNIVRRSPDEIPVTRGVGGPVIGKAKLNMDGTASIRISKEEAEEIQEQRIIRQIEKG